MWPGSFNIPVVGEHPGANKTYGADRNKFGHSDRDGVERFARHVLAGCASARFTGRTGPWAERERAGCNSRGEQTGAVYFTDGGAVGLNSGPGRFVIRWI